MPCDPPLYLSIHTDSAHSQSAAPRWRSWLHPSGPPPPACAPAMGPSAIGAKAVTAAARDATLASELGRGCAPSCWTRVVGLLEEVT
jgi:hypothetical protein